MLVVKVILAARMFGKPTVEIGVNIGRHSSPKKDKLSAKTGSIHCQRPLLHLRQIAAPQAVRKSKNFSAASHFMLARVLLFC
jgi:hypothetical protein